jgi:hypothetical protein
MSAVLSALVVPVVAGLGWAGATRIVSAALANEASNPAKGWLGSEEDFCEYESSWPQR